MATVCVSEDVLVEGIKEAIISLGGTRLDPYQGDESRAIDLLFMTLGEVWTPEEIRGWLNDLAIEDEKEDSEDGDTF